MKIYLHLGLRTAGALYLQRTLAANRERLRSAGVIFPVTGYVSEAKAGSEDQMVAHGSWVEALNIPTIATRYNYYRKALIEELLSSGATTAVFSSDRFLDPRPRLGLDPARARAVLHPFGSIHPVIYLRRQDRYADALYREMLCAPDRRIGNALEGFVRNFLGRQWLDFAARIKPWVQEFGADNVVVRSYDDLPDDDALVSDFLGLFSGIDAHTLEKADPTSELPRDLANVLRAVSEFDDPSPSVKTRIVGELCHSAEWRDPELEDASLVDDLLWEELRDEYADSNRELMRALTTGPVAQFGFEKARRPTTIAYQRYAMPQARQLVRERWPDVESEPHRISIQKVIDDTLRPSSLSEGRPKVGISALIRAPLPQILNWINFHLNAGFDWIALFIDGPPFYDELRSIPKVTVVNCDEEFWRNILVVGPRVLDQKLRPISKLGREVLVAQGMDWTSTIDGDELLCAGDFHAALAELSDDIDTVRVAPAEAVQHRGLSEVDGFESRVFKIKPLDRALWRRADEAYESVADLTVNGFFGHTQGKAITRASVEADFWGSHSVLNSHDPLNRIRLANAVLLHFETRPFSEWQARWESKLARDNSDTVPSLVRYRQYRVIEQAFEQGAEAQRQVYDDWYFMSDERIKALEDRDLVGRAKIPVSAFSGRGAGDIEPARRSYRARIGRYLRVKLSFFRRAR